MPAKNSKIPIQCNHCSYEWETRRRGKAYCPECGRVVTVSTEQIIVADATTSELSDDMDWAEQHTILGRI